MKKIILLFVLMGVLSLTLFSCTNSGGTGGGSSPSEKIIDSEEPDPASEEEEEGDDPESEEIKDVKDYKIKCSSGTENAYTESGNTITFSGLTEDSVYSISGTLNGNIVIDSGDYELELELNGFTIMSSTDCPLYIDGSEVSISAKKGTENYIYDEREEVTDEEGISSCVYALCDLNFKGKGSLVVKSTNNNGIHTKDDLKVKNLSLNVKCVDNALKGNDSVTISSGTITLIATKGDGIKTTNTSISDKGKQKGTVTISGGVVTIYAACDGIDAAYNAVIEESKEDADTLNLNIYTDKYSSYSEEVTATSSNKLYIRTKTTSYKYSIYYYNGDGTYKWVNSTTYVSKSSGMGMGPSGGTTYNYYNVERVTGYEKLIVYMYSSAQTQGQNTDYYARSSSMTLNDAYDSISVSYNSTSKSISCSWTNYTTQTSGMGPSGMGMQDGNTDKGDYSTKGIKADNEIIVTGGTVVINAYDDAIHTNNDVALENSEAATGNINISGGSLKIYSNDDGIHADGILTISGGVVSISNAYEGLEGTQIIINGGSISLVSKDDGFNATAESGNGITINGGYIYVYASGDGLDANTKTSYSGIIVNGGTTVVISTGNGDSALDTEKGYTYKSGSLIAIGASGGMSSENYYCSNFSSIGVKTNAQVTTSTYVSVKVGLNTKVVVKAPKAFSAMIVYLGSSSANISTLTSSSVSLDANGVYWG